MNTKTIGFVGAGRIARILLAGWQHARVELPAVVAVDSDANALKQLPQSTGPLDAVVDDLSQAARQDIVFIAVHPPIIPQVLPGLQSALQDSAIVVSLAPKFTITQLSALLGGFNRIVRVIPNASSLIGEGYNPVAFAPTLGIQDREALAALFKPLGQFPEVSEGLLEVYAVITAMGPTYFWPQCDELVSLAQAFGLTKSQATEAVSHMAAGAAHALTASNLTAGELLNLIPVHPLCECEASFRDVYRTKLPGVLEKIRPVTN